MSRLASDKDLPYLWWSTHVLIPFHGQCDRPIIRLITVKVGKKFYNWSFTVGRTPKAVEVLPAAHVVECERYVRHPDWPPWRDTAGKAEVYRPEPVDWGKKTIRRRHGISS